MATDEEGGDVTRLCYAQGSPYPGNAALGAVDDLELTSRIYHAIGAELAGAGITPALAGLLRTEMGFTGAIVSDALEMRGASAATGISEAAVRALLAGNDLLCIGGEFAKSPGAAPPGAKSPGAASPGAKSPGAASPGAKPPGAEATVEATVTAIVAAVRDGRLPADLLEAAAARATLLGQATPAERPAGGLPADLGVVAARRAVRIEGALPPALAGALVVQLEPAASVAVGEVPWGLVSDVPGVRLVRMSTAGPVWDAGSGSGADDLVASITAQAAGRPVVVVSRDTHRHPWARELVEALSRRHPSVVLVEMGWPASWRPAGIRAYVATYGASRASARAVAEAILSSP